MDQPEYVYITREFDRPVSPRRGQVYQKKEKERSPTPGPGSYSPREPSSPRSHALPQKGPRKGYKGLDRGEKDPSWIPVNSNPGPGHYYFDTNKTGPSYTLHDRCGGCDWMEKSCTPGPEYHPDVSASKVRSPRFTIRPKYSGRDSYSETQDAGYVMLPEEPIRPMSIRLREQLNLIPE
jgi:hypothetical protein